MSTPTQVKRPWRATIRTVVQLALAFALILPFVVTASGLDPAAYPWLAGVLAIAAGFTRVMALPQVEAFIARFLPWLAATAAADRDPAPVDPAEYGEAELEGHPDE